MSDIKTEAAAIKPQVETASVEQAFSLFVTCIGTLLEAERPLSSAMYGDPAFDDWFRAAEAARVAVLAAADGVIHAPVATVTDLRFRAVALNFEAILLTTDPMAYARYHSFFRHEAWLFYAPGRGTRVQCANQLLRAVRQHLTVLLACDDYLPEPMNAVNAPLAAMTCLAA